MQRFFTHACTGLCALTLLAAAPAAAEDWPSRPITFVVPFTPGGITDTTSRTLAKLLSDNLGQAVVVSNRPGAGGSIGVEAASRQPPDGYTMIYGTHGTHAANLALYQNIRYDPVEDFVPVHGLAQTSLILVVHPSRPFKTVPELIAYAKANPGKLNFGSAGTGTGTHLTAEVFQTATGITMTHVPYKGSSPALNDLVAGNLDLMFDYATVLMPLIEAGKLTPLATTAQKRLDVVPNIPTVGELGLPNATFSSWSAIFMPAKTPPAIAKRLGDAIAWAIMEPDMLQNTLRGGGVPFQGLRDDKLGEFVKTEVIRWRTIVQQSNARQE